MIVLDTNVLSELMRPQASKDVLECVRVLDPEDLFITSVTVAEILFGLAVMPPGKRHQAKFRVAEGMLRTEFAGRVLSFDEPAAREFADIADQRQRAGRRIEIVDCQIAAIARANAMSLATRNPSHFMDCGIDLINPWEA